MIFLVVFLVTMGLALAVALLNLVTFSLKPLRFYLILIIIFIITRVVFVVFIIGLIGLNMFFNILRAIIATGKTF